MKRFHHRQYKNILGIVAFLFVFLVILSYILEQIFSFIGIGFFIIFGLGLAYLAINELKTYYVADAEALRAENDILPPLLMPQRFRWRIPYKDIISVYPQTIKTSDMFAYTGEPFVVVATNALTYVLMPEKHEELLALLKKKAGK